jgi:hypothetical protein
MEDPHAMKTSLLHLGAEPMRGWGTGDKDMHSQFNDE